MAPSHLAMRAHGVGKDAQRELCILILDDDTFDRQRLRRQASEFAFPTKVDEAVDLYAFEEKLDAQSYDAILIDYDLVTGDGIEALDIIANHHINNTAALIMVAGAPRYEVAVQAMKHGCDEFVGKTGLKAEDLQRAVLEAILASTQRVGRVLSSDLEDMSNALARGVTGLCLTEMQPRLSRIQSHIEVLEGHPESSVQNKNAIDAIGEACAILEEFLIGVGERNPGRDAVSSTAELVALLGHEKGPASAGPS